MCSTPSRRGFPSSTLSPSLLFAAPQPDDKAAKCTAHPSQRSTTSVTKLTATVLSSTSLSTASPVCKSKSSQAVSLSHKHDGDTDDKSAKRRSLLDVLSTQQRSVDYDTFDSHRRPNGGASQHRCTLKIRFVWYFENETYVLHI